MVSNAADLSAGLRYAIRSLLALRRKRSELTLQQVRTALQQAETMWSFDGELLFAQDRTALLIELDELINRYGASKPASELLPAGRA
jgi:hypothetical protein